MNAQTLLLVLLVLACPLMMVLMMRGHGHGSHAGGCHGSRGDEDEATKPGSLDELRERRTALDAEIRTREEQERDPCAPGR